MSNTEFNQAKTHFELGLKFLKEKRLDDAEKQFITSLNILPDRLSTINNLIEIYIQKRNKAKLDFFLNSIPHLKNKEVIMFGFAYLKHFKNEYEESLKICKKIKELDQTQVLKLVAKNYTKQKNFLLAIKTYKKILSFDRTDYESYFDLGGFLFDLGKVRQAYFFFQKSKDLNSPNGSILFSISLCLLTLGYLKKGFHLYERRWEKSDSTEKKKFSTIDALEDIQNISDKKILIWDEQGLGDAILFSRFVIDLTKYTKKITLVVNKTLKDLLENLHMNIIVKCHEEVIENDFDFQISICSLPKLLSISKKDEIPFYKIKVNSNNEHNHLLLNSKNKLNIGITWFGNPNYLNDEYRSIPFKNFHKILSYKNINFYKLSKGIRKQDLFDFHKYNNIKNLGNKNFHELATAMKKMDLVVSSDTSIVHLAGIIGVRTILLLNFNSEWRWFEDKKKTKWYPSIDIIKQNKFGNWDGVFSELQKKIQTLYQEKYKMKLY